MAITNTLAPLPVNFSKNFIPVRFLSNSYLDGGGLEKENYRIYIELWVENEAHTAFEKAYDSHLPLKYGSSGQAETDLKYILHGILENAGPDYMDFADTSMLEAKKSIRKFYIKFGESIDNVVGSLTTTANFTVIYGGLSYTSSFSSSLLLQLQPDNATATKDRFLRQGNGTQYTRSNQPQFLYFFNTRATVNAVLKAKFYFSDGTTFLKNVCSGSLSNYRKFSFNTRFDAIITNSEIASRICIKYEIWLVNDVANVISETRTFYLDFQIKDYVRYFLYWSCWGAVDTLLTYGKNQSQIELVQSEAKRIRQAGDDIKKGDSLNFDIKLNSNFKCLTGFKSRREIGFNRDFFLSPFKFRYSGGNLLPIAVQSKSIDEVQDGNGLYAQNFDYKYLFDDDCYTEGDIEDGVGYDGFFFNLNPSNPTQGFNETDPTVPAWVKSISLTDISNWNAGGGYVGSAYTKAEIDSFFFGASAKTGYNKSNWDSAFGWGNHAGLYKAAGYNPSNSDILTALGFTPYNATNPAGYVSGAYDGFIKNQSTLQSAAQFYVDKGTFESKINIPHDLGTNRKVSFKFRSTAGTGGTPPPMGAQYLYNLLDVNVLTPANGQALVYNSAAGKWQNQNIVTDLSNYWNKTEIDNFFSGGIAKTGYNKTNWDVAFGWGNHAGLYKAAGYTPSNSEVLTALGFTPYNATNPAGYVSGAYDGFIKNQSTLQSAAQFYVDKGSFESKLNIPHDLGINRKVSFKFRATAGTGGSPPPGGAQYLYNLLDVSLTSLINGQALIFNGTTWVNQNIVTDLSNYYTKAQTDGLYPTKAGAGASGSWGINITGYASQLNGFSNQVLYTILDGPANGPVIKVRYDSSTAERYIDFGFKDGNGVYSEGLKIYNAGALTWIGNTILHSGNYNSYAPTLTGGNASGTWVISISGNAATASNASLFNGQNASFYTDIASRLGFTPYNSTNPTGFITSAALTSYAFANGSNAAGIWEISSYWREFDGNLFTANPLYMLSYNSIAGKWMPTQQGQVRTFLGLGSAAYLNASVLETANTVVQRDSVGAVKASLFLKTNTLFGTSVPIYEDLLTYGATNTFAKILAGNTNNANFATYLKFQVTGAASNSLVDALALDSTGATFTGTVTAPTLKATSKLYIPHNLGTNRNVSLKFVG